MKKYLFSVISILAFSGFVAYATIQTMPKGDREILGQHTIVDETAEASSPKPSENKVTTPITRQPTTAAPVLKASPIVAPTTVEAKEALAVRTPSTYQPINQKKQIRYEHRETDEDD
jgi:hypothetical protein